jgi:restriction system protein
VSDEKKPEPLPPDWVPQPRQTPPWYLDDGGQDAAATIARNEEHRRRQQAAILANTANDGWVPQPRPAQPIYIDDDGSQHTAAIIAINEHRRRQNMAAIIASMMTNHGGNEEYAPPDNFPVLVSQTIIVPHEKNFEGELIRAITIPLQAIIQKLAENPSLMYEINPRKWEEIVAATYEASGRFDRVRLTPPSGDFGRDLIAEKDGFGSVRFIESVKRYKPGNEVTAEHVRAILGVLSGDQKATKALISTTWEFAPKVEEDPFIKPFLHTRLELVNGIRLIERLKEYTTPKSK